MRPPAKPGTEKVGNFSVLIKIERRKWGRKRKRCEAVEGRHKEMAKSPAEKQTCEL